MKPASTLPAVPARDRTVRQRPIRNALLVFAGAGLIAASFNLLLRPQGLASGGLPGLSLLFEWSFGFEPAVTQITLNLIIIAASVPILGRRFALSSLIGSLSVPLLVWLTRDWSIPVTDRLLSAVCGGVGAGLGVGLVYRGQGSVGGFSALALMINRRRGVRLDHCLWIMDGAVVMASAFLVPAESVLAALVAIALIGRTARAVLTGFDTAVIAFIVSEQPTVIRRSLLHTLDLGVTILEGKGGFTEKEREVLMVVMRPDDVPRLKAHVSQLDPAAFLVLSNASEVLGHGFQPHLG